MPREVEATYENGLLKLDKPLPLAERERVTVTVQPLAGRIRRSAGLIPWRGDAASLECLP